MVIYQQHNPGKLGEINTNLAKYVGKEHQLYLKVCNKYKVPPQPEYNPGGAGGMPGANPFGGGAPGGNPFGQQGQQANPFGGGLQGFGAQPGAQNMGCQPGAPNMAFGGGGNQPQGFGAQGFGGAGAQQNPFGGGNVFG